ncbi:MAG: hypothetical protein EPN41_12500 [Candidimonas sp.]|nr:MAG: hypothetical protein EPN41_12500 [Candidimonas sp.]
MAWPYVVTIGLLLEWVSIRRQRTIIAARSGTLSLTSDRQWRWESAQGVRLTALCPVRVWVGPSWITLHFAHRGGLESKEAMLQVTLWKSQTSPQSWRWLRVCLAGRVARPEVVPGRVGQ